MLTDQNPQDIALMTVREKFLDAFKNEIPYNLKFTVEHWDLSEEGMLSKKSFKMKWILGFLLIFPFFSYGLYCSILS